MNKGLIATITTLDDEIQVAIPDESPEDFDGYLNCFQDFPPNVALAIYPGADHKMLDRALCGPNILRSQGK